jgi:hypothetical protein
MPEFIVAMDHITYYAVQTEDEVTAVDPVREGEGEEIASATRHVWAAGAWCTAPAHRVRTRSRPRAAARGVGPNSWPPAQPCNRPGQVLSFYSVDLVERDPSPPTGVAPRDFRHQGPGKKPHEGRAEEEHTYVNAAHERSLRLCAKNHSRHPVLRVHAMWA